MIKKLFLVLVCISFLVSSAAFATNNTNNEIVKLDEKTFVLVKHLTVSNESISSVLSLFKVEGDKLVLKDEIHYEGTVQLQLWSKNDKSSITRYDLPSQ